MPALGSAPAEHQPGIAPRPTALPTPISEKPTLASALECQATMQPPGEVPGSLNLWDFLARVTKSNKMTANLQRLIWSISGLLALVGGSVTAIAIVALHHRVAGSVSLATAAVVGIISLVARILLRKKRGS